MSAASSSTMSTLIQNTTEAARLTALHSWLHAQLGQLYANSSLSAPIGDASSRRYFRLALANGSRLIIMDAPPPIDNRAFIAVAELLHNAVNVPTIIAKDLIQGFLLLEDLGETDLQSALEHADKATATKLFNKVLKSLIALQTASLQKNQPSQTLPIYNRASMTADLDRFAEWYAGKHLGKTLTGHNLQTWQTSRDLLIDHALAQGQVWVHFDFHSRNLLVAEKIGIIDFQDARIGPITYDVVSLLKDVYVRYVGGFVDKRAESFRLDLCARYWEKARAAHLPVPANFDQFYIDFEWMGVFRHLRTLGTFARLAHRDGKMRYIADMPTTLIYLRDTCTRYADLQPLYRLINQLTAE